MFIDTHCHLNFKAFDADLDEVIKQATDNGIKKIIIPGAKLDSSQKAIDISQIYQHCFTAVGIHPHHADEFQKHGSKEIESQLQKMFKAKRVVAIGEIGLDEYHYKNTPPVTKEMLFAQIELFELQLFLAQTNNLPVIVHCRHAQRILLPILQKYIRNNKIKGVLHCFEGKESFLTEILNLGFYVGFDGNSTFEENDHLRTLIRITPIDRLLLETDSPYLTPNPFRRSRNEPSYLIYTAKMVSETTKIPLQDVAFHTSKNATDLFRI